MTSSPHESQRLTPEELAIADRAVFSGHIHFPSGVHQGLPKSTLDRQPDGTMTILLDHQPAIIVQSIEGVWSLREKLAAQLPDGTIEALVGLAQKVYPRGKFTL